MNESTALAPRTGLLPQPRDWETMLQMATMLVKSRLVSAKTAEEAIAIIQKGQELGVPPMTALGSIHVIEGKPTAAADLMRSLIYRDHGDNALRFIETDDQHCVIEYRRRGWDSPMRFTYTIEDAKRAGVGSRPNYQKHPSAMLRARATSAVAMMAFPDSIGGMYTPEELGAEVEVSDGGEVRIIDIEQPAPAAESPHEDVTDATFTAQETTDVIESPNVESARRNMPPAATSHKGDAEADRAALVRTVNGQVLELTKLRFPHHADDSDSQTTVADSCKQALGLGLTARFAEMPNADLRRAHDWLTEQIKSSPRIGEPATP